MATVVIGAGIGGLAAALYCAASGMEVDVFERRREPGGKAYSFSLGSYRFDAGPSLLTLAHYFEDLFAYSGAKLSDYLRLLPLNPITRYVFSDGSSLHSRPLPQFLDEIEGFAPAGRPGMERYFNYSRRMYEISEEFFLRNPINYWRQGGPMKALRNLSRLGSIDVLRSMDRANRGFAKDPRLQQFLNRFATYNGSTPYKAPAALNSIGWVEHGLPVYALEGGVVQVPRALEKRCRELGVRFHYGHELTALRPIRHSGWELIFRGGKSISASKIISNIDIRHWYTQIVDIPGARAGAGGKYFRGVPSSSAVVFFWGISKKHPELDLHNIFFSSDYRQEFHEIHEKHILPTEPTIYVNISSKSSPTDAPQDKETWFVMINAPWKQANEDQNSKHNERSESSERIKELRRRVIERLSAHLGRNIAQFIEEERILTPSVIEQETGSYLGSLYGMSSNTALTAFRRHPNISPYLDGVYHCGGSVHPGGGMPLALSSGIIAAKSCVNREVL